ncbi:MAG: hypothetical protein A2138_24425 [Deltaproteobacteria bacterium RBG_16_71_12]|nr:MAG: hypothetical protein A2138_24425 [Deltaproteobacteria bacterium RBG_16_71_12]
MNTTATPLLLAAALASGACGKSADDGMPALAAAIAAVEHRTGAIRDYVLSGTATDLGSGKALPFTYAFAQPTYAKATIGAAQVTAFDGNAVVIVDHANKVARRQEVKGQKEDELLLTLNALFADFTVEGWRPPLLRPRGMSARVERGADGERWVISVPIDDDTLAEQRVTLRSPDGAFLEKAFVDKRGNVVAGVKVLEELKDAATGLSFPKAWERTGPQGRFKVALDGATVNGGLAKEQFSVAVPDGYRAGT